MGSTSVVITGVCGFIGSHLAEDLLGRSDVEVIGVDRLGPGDDLRTSVAVDRMMDNPRFHLLSADVGDRGLMPRLREAAAVVHLAAETDVAASWKADFLDHAESLISTQALLRACRHARVPRLVVASSSHVYQPAPLPVSEQCPPEPMSPYGVIKLATERLAVAYTRRPESTMSTVALRFFTAFGPRCNPAMVVARMFTSAMTGEPVPLYGTATTLHTWTYISDLVQAVMLSLDLPLAPGHAEAVNVGGVSEASLLDVGELVGAIVGSPVTWRTAGERAGDVGGLRPDLTRARELLGFNPSVGLRDGLERMWASLQATASPVR